MKNYKLMKKAEISREKKSRAIWRSYPNEKYTYEKVLNFIVAMD